MKLGTIPLMIGVAAAGARVLGLEAAADSVAIGYLAVATFLMTRSAGVLAVRA